MPFRAHPESHEPHRTPHRPHRHAPRRRGRARRGPAPPVPPDAPPLAIGEAAAAPAQALAPWHFLNFLPDPHQHGSLRPSCSLASTRRCCTATGPSSATSSSPYALGWSSAVPPEYSSDGCRLASRCWCCGTPFSPSISTSTL